MKHTSIAGSDDSFIRGIQALLNQLEEIAEKAVRHPDPGLEFDRLGARDLLFKLEAFGRFLRYCLGSKKTESFLNPVKEAEDFLGEYDHSEEIYLQLKRIKDVPASIKKHFQNRHQESLGKLNTFLNEKAWLSADGKYKELRQVLNRLNFKESFNFQLEYREFLKEECKQLHDDYRKGKINFYAIENGLHEFRRDLRWISIYAQISEGLCRLRPMRVVPEEFKSFLHTTYIRSPYNRLPEGPYSEQALLLQAPVFYALSYLIDALGKLKDEGLLIHAAYEAIYSAGFITKDEALIIKKLKLRPERLTELSEEAELICDKLMLDLSLMPRLLRDLNRAPF